MKKDAKIDDYERITEQNSLYNHLEKKSVSEIVKEINQEDHKVAAAVEKCLPDISHLISDILPRMRQGGRVFYIGAGTSGRLGVLDASEIPPTYGMPPELFIGLIAGGDKALRKAVENAEDSSTQAWLDLQVHAIKQEDTLIGIAASGSTPYVLGALKRAKEEKILTACICSNPGSPITAYADHAIITRVGPEYVTGSSRMKSGTAQKMVLNMISTSLMIKMGRVQDNKMVNRQLNNEKLTIRACKMLQEDLGITEQKAHDLLQQYGSVKAAMDAYKKG